MGKRGHYFELVVNQEQTSENHDFLDIIKNNFPSQQDEVEPNFLIRNAEALHGVGIDPTTKILPKLMSSAKLHRKLEKAVSFELIN